MTDLEIWKPVVGNPTYQVSSFGRVRSLDHLAKGRNGCDRLIRGRVLSPGRANATGHLSVSLGRGGKVYVHVLVAQAFLGEKPFPEAEVRHRDGDSRHNDWRNLRWSTRGDNIRDLKRHLGRRGALMEWEVRAIKVCLRNGEKGVDLAERFGVGPSAISQIKLGHNHSDVVI